MTEDRRKQNIPVHKERRENCGEDRLEFKSRFGSIKAGGTLAVLLVVFLLCAGGIGYMVWEHDRTQTETTKAARAERMEQFKQMDMNQRALIDAMNNMTYVLTLPQGRREQLNMDMPRSMREILLMQERPSR